MLAYKIAGIMLACDPLDLRIYMQLDEYDSYAFHVANEHDLTQERLRAILREHGIYQHELYNKLVMILGLHTEYA